MLKSQHNTLFLLGVIAVVVAPHVPQLPLWCTAFVTLVLLGRGWIAYKGWALPKRWIVFLALCGCVWGVISTHQTLLGPAAGTTMVVALLALKTLELRAQRDAFVVFFLGFFVLMANFLESQSLGIALAMVVGMAGLLTSLVNAQLAHEDAGFKTSAFQAFKLMVWGAPLMVFLFVFFPRVAPLWALPTDTPSGRSGLSEDMTVGRIAELANDDQIALRIKFDGAAPGTQQLYWRGPILSRFDGQTWRPTNILTQSLSMPEALVGGKPLSYEVTLQPNQKSWLMTLDLTPQNPQVPGQGLSVSQDFQWYVNQPITEVLRYRATSFLQYQYGLTLTDMQMRELLYLPKGSNPRIQDWAAQRMADPAFRDSSALDKAQWVIQQLATGGYRYSLNPGVFGRDSADEFWFDRKVGFCEHIASTFVVMMRAMGVPSRVVTGYQGGERNEVDGFWTVRQSDAHAWAEVWLPPGSAQGQGWVRLDPTGAVAPERIQSATRLEPQRGPIGNVVSQVFGRGGVDWLLKMRSLWEASENYWTQKVLNFSRDQQYEFLKKIGFEAPSEEALGQAMAITFTAGLLLFLLTGKVRQWKIWSWVRQDPWQVLWERFKADAAAGGVAAGADATPRQMARLLREHARSRPEQAQSDAEAAAQWLLRLEALRYADSSQRQPSGQPHEALVQLKRDWQLLRRRGFARSP